MRYIYELREYHDVSIQSNVILVKRKIFETIIKFAVLLTIAIRFFTKYLLGQYPDSARSLMTFLIVIAGEAQCELFAEICLVADYLIKQLPNFCYERIEKSVLEWRTWLCKVNQKNKWHHTNSPIIWKELLIKGSKPYYIGGASDFLEYCYSYYHFDVFLACEKFAGLSANFSQFKKKLKNENERITEKSVLSESGKQLPNTQFTVCISGAGFPLTMHLISGLLEMTIDDYCISKIFIYDSVCSGNFLEYVQQECAYVETNHPGKIVRFVEKIGGALTNTDLFIILDHVPFEMSKPIGDWLHANAVKMNKIALMINASASRKMRILFPNLGPACYNATVLMHSVNEAFKANIAVATSDIGLELAPFIAEIADIPLQNIFCPPVWGFVGINHLSDIKTTIHKYNAFEPYNRFLKVRNSTLKIGSLTPEIRTLEYLVCFDETVWIKIAEQKEKCDKMQVPINKAVSLLNTVKLWLFGPRSDDIVSLGIQCDGSFGLTFDGIFSQPSRFVNGKWIPANDFMCPKDSQMKLAYLEQMANLVMKLKEKELPEIIPFHPCSCKRKYFTKKGVW